MLWDSLTLDQQKALQIEEEDQEITALDDGIRRFRRQNAKQPMSKWPACRSLITTAADALIEAIKAEAQLVATGRGMRGATHWGHIFLYMDPEVLSIATICAILDALSQGAEDTTQQKAMYRVGTAIEMETQFTILKREAPRLKAVMERKIRRWERRAIRRAMSRIDGDCADPWPYRRKLNVGAKLVEMAIEHCGMFEFRLRQRTRRRVSKVICLTDAAGEIIAKTNEHLEILSPTFRPMLVPPNEWGPEDTGGYRVLSRYHDIVKSRSDYPPMPADHEPLIYEGTNILQRTEWCINQLVLDTQAALWKAGGDQAGLPSADDYEIPPKPEGDDTEWRIKAEKIHRTNARMEGKRLAFMPCLALAEAYRDRPFFYFPHHCDFRGRVYPIPQYLHPQGNDVARGLLMFAERLPLGERGLWWLYVQFANHWGEDKVPFPERVAWAEQKLWPALEHWDGDPLNFRHLWQDADNPWQALATLIEIEAAEASGHPEAYECGLPVSVDGSNSGLQHYSAMLRDRKGAELVNLTDSKQMADVYSDIAATTGRLIREDMETARESGVLPDTTEIDLPRLWLEQGITRKLCKRPGMTYSYGVTLQGLKDALISDGFVDWAHHPFSAAQYIGKKIWAAIQENITGAAVAMDWLRECAKCANKVDKLLEWRTPAGFHVTHPYSEPKTIRVRCLSGEADFRVYEPDLGIRAHKQRNSLPPNFIHSLDASHLIMTMVEGTQQGITSWMMIHDSFGTHACHVDQLRDVLREQFIVLYSVDVLEDFRQQVIEQTGHDPGPPPPKGDFDLMEVARSEFIFS